MKTDHEIFSVKTDEEILPWNRETMNFWQWNCRNWSVQICGKYASSQLVIPPQGVKVWRIRLWLPEQPLSIQELFIFEAAHICLENTFAMFFIELYFASLALDYNSTEIKLPWSIDDRKNISLLSMSIVGAYC